MRQTTLSAFACGAGSLSIESMPIEQLLSGRTVLTLEEETIILQETADEQAGIEADLDEATRTEQITDNMLNLADTADGIDALTPDQAAMIDTASEMAVAGTDTNPDEVIPAMEKYIGLSLSKEGFAEDLRKRAAEIWARIRQFVIEAWGRLKQLFSQIFLAIPRNLHRVAELKKAVAEKHKAIGSASPKKATVSILVGNASVSYNGYVVKSAKELDSGLTELSALAKYAFGQYPKSVKHQGDIIAAALKSFDPKEAQTILSETVKKMVKANFGAVLTNPTTGYLGDFDMRPVRIDPKRTAGLSDAQLLNALQHTKVELVQRVNSRMGMHTAADKEFATMTFTDMATVLSSVESLLKQIVAFEGSADQKAMDKVRDDLIKAGDAANVAIAKVQSQDEAGKTEREFALDVMKSLMNFNTTFTRWNTILTPAVIRKLINTSKVSMNLVDRSLAAY